jgi:predicted permease
MAWLDRLRATFRPGRMDAELDDELRFHVERRAEDLIAEGMRPDEAWREAELMFGNSAWMRESTRERNVLPWLQSAMQDAKYAFRAMRRNGGFTAAAVLSLALGMGANTAMFSLLDSLVLRSLPVEKPGRLVRVLDGEFEATTYPLFERLRTHSHALAGVAGSERTFGDMRIEERGEQSMAALQPVTGEFFDLLGVKAARGRVFHRDEAKAAEGAVAVIGDRYWHSHYGGSDAALGAHFRFGSKDFTVVGVAPAGFRGAFVDFPADLWIPLEQVVPMQPDFWKRARGVTVLGRLADGVTRERAAAEASGLIGRKILMEPGANGFSGLRGKFGAPLAVVECVVGLVLMIACANLANLMLAGAAARQRELAVRQAIGAGRARLVRQLLTESLLVAGGGAVLALGVAAWLSRAMLRFLPPKSAPALSNLSFHLEPRVLAFTGGLTILTCLLFGLAPALRATRGTLGSGLRETAGTGSGRWMNRGLVVGEVALCTVLLAGAGLFVRTLGNLRHVDSGFSGEHVLVATVSPRGGGDYRRRSAEQVEALRSRVAALPGVVSVGFSNTGILSGFMISGHVAVDGFVPKSGDDGNENLMRISPGFFAAMSTPILAGRDFTDGDDASARQVAIVNEAFARKYFAGVNPVGRQFHASETPDVGPIQIAGLVKDTKPLGLREAASPIYYRPYRQQYGGAVTLAVRSAGDPLGVAAGIERASREIDPGIALTDVVPFTEIQDRTLATERMVAQSSAAFGALALIVACIGLYGVLAYSVARRTREIGVRMALGATRGGVEWMVLRESLALVALGFAAGVPCALALGRFVAAMLYGLTPADAGNLVVASAVMMAVAGMGAFLPARRAAKVDPMTALRCD